MFDSIFRLNDQGAFQGSLKARPYFELWFFRLVGRAPSDGRAPYSCVLIPGISISTEGRNAFIQFIDGPACASTYFEYGLESFSASSHKLSVRIEDSIFTEEKIRLSIASEVENLSGEIAFKDAVRIPSRLASSGVVGPFASSVGCKRAVIAIKAGLEGSLVHNGSSVDLSGGYGYIEKSWGRSYPAGWIWAQCGSIGPEKGALSLSVANIALRSGFFLGISCSVLARGKLLAISNYTGARIQRASLSKGQLCLTIRDKRYELELEAKGEGEASLMVPDEGAMTRLAQESLKARIRARLTRLSDGSILLDGDDIHGGFELVNPIMDIIRQAQGKNNA